MTTLETLRAANALLSVPSAWSQSGHYAVDAAGKAVDCKDKRAVAWCVLGAITRVADNDVARIGAADALYRACPERSLSTWNDHHATHAGVMALYAKAIDAVARAGVV